MQDTKKEKTKKGYSIQIQRSNVTVAKFFAHINYQCKKRGITFGFSDRDHFENFDGDHISYYEKDGKQVFTTYRKDGTYETQTIDTKPPCKAETVNLSKLNKQTYVLYYDGYCYNEIIEFSYYDEKTGFGYYHQSSTE